MYRDALLMAGGDQRLPGIGDGGHTRVGHQRDPLACLHPGDQLLAAGVPVVFKVTHKRLFDAEVVE